MEQHPQPENAQAQSAETISVPKKKFSGTNISLLSTHTINLIESVFVSTFLVSFIYSISENYLLNIGLFYLFTYLVMGVIYYLLSMIIDRTNRVIIYRFALIVRGAFLLCVVLTGKNLAQYVILAGCLLGVSEGFYWTSYNLMKNELVPNSLMKKYASLQLTFNKIVNIVVPITLGKIIDADSFSTSAIIILCVVAVQFVISFFIKSKRPENSSFNMREFFSDVKGLGEHRRLITLTLVAAFTYGIFSVISPLNTILFMINFNSNFSLGLFTSLFSVTSVLFLLLLSKFSKAGKRKKFYFSASIISLIAAILVSIFTVKEMVLVYMFCYTVGEIVHTYYFDVFRNIILKKFGLYHDIAEFQCCIECTLELARVVAFGTMVVVGLIGASVGLQSLLVCTKVLLCVSTLSIFATNMLLMVEEKHLIKADILQYGE